MGFKTFKLLRRLELAEARRSFEPINFELTTGFAGFKTFKLLRRLELAEAKERIRRTLEILSF